MMTTDKQYPFLEGGGALGELTRRFNWAATPIGAPAQWPSHLRTTVSLILSSRFPMFLWWGDEMIQFYNDAYRPSLGNEGKHPSALGGKALDTWPEIWPIIYPLISQVKKTGKATWSEDQLVPIYRNGQLEDVYWTFGYSAVKDEEGHIDGVLVVCTETTEKVNYLQELKQSKDELLFAIEATELGTWDLNPATNRFTSNTRLKEWFGLRPEEEILLPLAINVIAEHDRDRVMAAIGHALQYASGGHYDVEYTIIHPVTNKERVVHAKGKALFNTEKVPLRFNGTLQDITEQKRAQAIEQLSRQKLEEIERSLRNTILKAPVAMCIFAGPTHIVEIANERMIALWGRSGAEVLNKPIFEGLPEASNQGFEQALDQVFETGNIFSAEDIPVTLPRGNGVETVYINLVYAPNVNADGVITGIIAIANDVTQQVLARRKIEQIVAIRTQQLETANSALQLINADLSQFAYIASHDLQEPVRKISTYLNMLEKTLPDLSDTQKNYIDKITTSTQRMRSLIRDVLSFSQLSKEGAAFSPVDLQEIFSNNKTDFELRIQQTGAIVQCSGLPVIEAIPVQMDQLFSNLLSNALKFTRPGVQPVITVQAALMSGQELQKHAELKPGIPYYRIEFTDNGIGFDAQYAYNMFKIFQRLHTGKEFDGTGIGLAICKKIVQNHNGEIFATPGALYGACFTILLPAKHNK